MIIVIAGIKRSFSTGQFNLVRLAMKQAGYKTCNQGPSYKPRSVPEGSVDIVKIHPFKKELAEAADYIFTTDRNDSGIQASLDRFYESKSQYEPIHVMRGWLDQWRQYPHHYQHYSLWKSDPEGYVKEIVQYLGLDVDHKEVLEEFRKVKPPNEGYDRSTFLFHNHITSQ